LDLEPGDYSLIFSAPNGFTASPQDQGADDTIDSDANPNLNGSTIQTSLASGENDPTWDAGFYEFASIGDFVWNDSNADGIQDPGENGIAGVTVNLIDENGIVIATTETDANGEYLFNGLTPGDYNLEFETPFGYSSSPQDTGNDDEDSDVNPNTGQTVSTTLVSGENDTNWDAGFFEFASLGNYVWIDDNKDGIQEAGELPVENVIVTLFAADGTQVASTTTDADGLYLFDNLIPGDYYVDFTIPTGYIVTEQDAGTNDAIDSDVDPSNGQTIVTTLESGENDPTWDLGLYQTASVGDFVWNDSNADGSQDPNENGIPGVTVTLLDQFNNPIASVLTGPDGSYLFDNLDPGTYSVQFEEPTGFTPSPYEVGNENLDSDANPSNNLISEPVVLGSGERITNVDAGFYETASIGDFVWLDMNADGIQDPGENGIEVVLVTLLDENGIIIATTNTDQNGFYEFNDLIPGDYSLIFESPAGFNSSPNNVGGDSTIDSDAIALSGGSTIQTTLVSGENDPTWDAGFYETASIGNFVWNDINADGIQDSNESGIQGVSVNLFDENGILVATTTTDANGEYIFDDLLPGTYEVMFENLAGYFLSPTNATNSSDDSNGLNSTVTLNSGDSDTSIDIGFYQVELLISEFDVNCNPTSCNESDIQIDVEINWMNLSEDIQVSFNGEIQIIDPSTSTSPQTISFGAPADGSTNLDLNVSYTGFALNETRTVDLTPCDCENAASTIDGFVFASDQVVLTSVGSNFSSYETGTVLGGERDVETFLTVKVEMYVVDLFYHMMVKMEMHKI